MSLVSLILLLIVVGVALWLIHAVIPMDPKIRTILDAVVVVVTVLWVLQAFGIFSTYGRPLHIR